MCKVKTPDDGQSNCLEHVEFIPKINLRISVSSLFYYKNLIRMLLDVGAAAFLLLELAKGHASYWFVSCASLTRILCKTIFIILYSTYLIFSRSNIFTNS